MGNVKTKIFALKKIVSKLITVSITRIAAATEMTTRVQYVAQACLVGQLMAEVKVGEGIKAFVQAHFASNAYKSRQRKFF